MPTLTFWTPDKVASAQDPAAAYAEYVQQCMGMPWPTVKDVVILRKECNEIFKHYPAANWHTMCRLAMYFVSNKQRFERVWRIPQEFRKAWADGALPELDGDTVDEALEARIRYALTREEDVVWRRRLLLSTGRERLAAASDWERERG